MDTQRQQIEEYYKDKLNKSYQGDFYQPRYHKFIELLKNKKNARILDIGCGAGDFLLMLKDQGFSKVEGLDYSRQAKNFAEKRGLKVTLCDFEKETLSLSGKRFDVIVSGDVLEHIFEPEIILKKAGGLLGKGGQFLISVPNAGWYLNGILLTFFPRFLRLSPAFGVWTHCNQFTFYTLRILLENSGFKVLNLSGVPLVQPKPSKESLTRKIAKFILKLPIKFTDLFSNLYPPVFSSHLVILAIKK